MIVCTACSCSSDRWLGVPTIWAFHCDSAGIQTRPELTREKWGGVVPVQGRLSPCCEDQPGDAEGTWHSASCLAGCVALAKLLSLLEPQSPHL